MSSVAAPLPLRLARLVRILAHRLRAAVRVRRRLLAVGGWPGTEAMVWVTVAMVGARTLAMALNRLVDAELDARNPRTATRELPAGALTRLQVVGLSLAALAVYLVAVFQLDPIVRWLWPIPVVLFVVYPYLKRVTWWCPPVARRVAGSRSRRRLGRGDRRAAVAGVGAGGAVCLWVAGFDLYSLFDREHDLETGLHSWATRFGVRGVFVGAAAMHAGTVALLALQPASGSAPTSGTGSGSPSSPCSSSTSAIVRPNDLRRLDAAFFTVNGVISIVLRLRRAGHAALSARPARSTTIPPRGTSAGPSSCGTASSGRTLLGARPLRFLGVRNAYLAGWPTKRDVADPVLADGRPAGRRAGGLVLGRPRVRAAAVERVRAGDAGAARALPRSGSSGTGTARSRTGTSTWSARMSCTQNGCDTRDMLLDVVCDASGRWRWKDEDELELAVAVGAITGGPTRSSRGRAGRRSDRAVGEPVRRRVGALAADPDAARRPAPADWDA